MIIMQVLLAGIAPAVACAGIPLPLLYASHIKKTISGTQSNINDSWPRPTPYVIRMDCSSVAPDQVGTDPMNRATVRDGQKPTEKRSI